MPLLLRSPVATCVVAASVDLPSIAHHANASIPSSIVWRASRCEFLVLERPGSAPSFVIVSLFTISSLKLSDSTLLSYISSHCLTKSDQLSSSRSSTSSLSWIILVDSPDGFVCVHPITMCVAALKHPLIASVQRPVYCTLLTCAVF